MAQKLANISLNQLSQIIKGQLESQLSKHTITLNLNGNDIANVGSLYINDDEKLYFGTDSDASVEYDADGTSELRFAGAAAIFEQAVTFDANVKIGNDYATTTFENQLSDNEMGTGDILKYGTGTTVAGKLYYLHTDGAWTNADADAPASAGPLLLAIALGTSPTTHGMLTRGYIKISSDYVNGSAAIGKAVYASTTDNEYDFTAPSASGDIVRVMGYCIDIDSSDILLYFRPDNTWVEIA